MAAPPDQGPPPDPGHWTEGDHPRPARAAGLKTPAHDQTPAPGVHQLRGSPPVVFH